MSRRQRFERLYGDHAAAVQAYARRRIDEVTADDVVSEVFLTAWRRADETLDDPRAWLLAVARRVIANQRRSTERQIALFQRMSAAPSAHADLEVGGARAPVLLALAALRPADRELLLLIGWDEVSPAQAAQILRVQPSTLSMRLRRARERLAAQLEKQTPTRARTTNREEAINA